MYRHFVLKRLSKKTSRAVKRARAISSGSKECTLLCVDQGPDSQSTPQATVEFFTVNS